MDTNYRERMSFKNALILLTVLSCGFSVAAIFISDLFVAPASACLTVLLFSERRGSKTFSLISLASIAAFNVLFLVLSYFTQLFIFSVSGIQAIVMALVLYLMFKRNAGKGKTVIALFAVSVLFFVAYLWLVSASYGFFSLRNTVEFYKAYIVAIKDEFIQMFSSFSDQLKDVTMAAMFSEEALSEIANSIISMLPAFFLIGALVVTGLTCKIFTYAVYRMTGNQRIYEWKFVPHVALAYAYACVFILFAILRGRSDVFSIVVMNLAVVLMCVYVYFGFGFASALLSVRYTRGFSWSILIVAFIIIPPIAFVVLSFFGVVFNVLYRKKMKLQ